MHGWAKRTFVRHASQPSSLPYIWASDIVRHELFFFYGQLWAHVLESLPGALQHRMRYLPTRPSFNLEERNKQVDNWDKNNVCVALFFFI